MKGREEQLGNLHLNIYEMIPPSSRSEKLSRGKHKLPTDREERVRCNLQITEELFHIQMLPLCLADGWVWPLDSSASCRISVTSAMPFAVTDHTVGVTGRPVQRPATRWQTSSNSEQTPQRCALICSVTRWLSHPAS